MMTNLVSQKSAVQITLLIENTNIYHEKAKMYITRELVQFDSAVKNFLPNSNCKKLCRKQQKGQVHRLSPFIDGVTPCVSGDEPESAPQTAPGRAARGDHLRLHRLRPAVPAAEPHVLAQVSYWLDTLSCSSSLFPPLLIPCHCVSVSYEATKEIQIII